MRLLAVRFIYDNSYHSSLSRTFHLRQLVSLFTQPYVLFTTTRITLHSGDSRRSPLLQSAVSRGPRLLVQYTAAIVRFLPTSNERAVHFYFSCQTASHIPHTSAASRREVAVVR